MPLTGFLKVILTRRSVRDQAGPNPGRVATKADASGLGGSVRDRRYVAFFSYASAAPFSMRSRTEPTAEAFKCPACGSSSISVGGTLSTW